METTATKAPTVPELRRDLRALAEELVQRTIALEPLLVSEGRVMTPIDPAPYRRLDAQFRALAYVRVREKKRCVRVDISSLWPVWLVKPPKGLQLSPEGRLAFGVKDGADVERLAAFLVELVRKSKEDRR